MLIKIISLTILLLPSYFFAQQQKGNDIDGSMSGEHAGWSISMPDNNAIAIGSIYHSPSAQELNKGQARVFEWNSNSWIQKGNSIIGDEEHDRLGWSISMPTPNVLAVSSIHSGQFQGYQGHIQVYDYNSNQWNARGFKLTGSWEFGSCIDMPDENTIAISTKTSNTSGQVQIHTWQGGPTWVQKGNSINGITAGDFSGYSISMPDSNTIAIGAPWNDTVNPDAGQARIYRWKSNAWIQKGNSINGIDSFDNFGSAISMPDSNTVAISSQQHNTSTGLVQIYRWNGNNWVQKGNDINGLVSYEKFGSSLSMADSNTISIGAKDALGSGLVRVYKWIGNNWLQLGSDIIGEAQWDGFGYKVSMPDSNTIGIGAPFNDAGVSSSEIGHVRVYNIGIGIGITENNFIENVNYYPNPASSTFTIDFNNSNKYIQLFITNELGQDVLKQQYNHCNKITVNINNLKSGLYFITIINEEGNSTSFKVLKDK